MGLDQRGGIAVGEVIFYIPVLIVSFILVLRHGFRRQAGWIFLFLLSNGELHTIPFLLIHSHTLALVRILGGITPVLYEQNPSNTTLQIIFGIMESAGLSPLMLATLGFLSTVYASSPCLSL